MSRKVREQDIMVQEDVEIFVRREFGGAELGDKRRSARLERIALQKARKPHAAMTTNCERSEAQLVSRFFDREEVTAESVIAPHVKQTAKRCKERKVVLAVQDTTGLSFSTHYDLEGLGHIGSKKIEQGIWLHSGLAVTPDRTPLGVLFQKLWVRDPEEFGIKKKRRERPFRDKESYRWAGGVAAASEVLKDAGQVVVVGDRESDIFEVFNLPRGENVDLLIRATQNRCVEIYDENGVLKEAKLFEEVESSPVLGAYELKVPARNGRKKRDATIEVRAKLLLIKPPSNRSDLKDAKPIKMYCISAVEAKPPEDGKEGIDWKLLTTMSADNFNDCNLFIKYYSARWVIEEYHKVLKSGCKIEKLQFETLERLYPAMAICCVIAWRILFLSKFARENPGDDASLVSSEVERKVLSAWLRSKKEKNWLVKTVKDFVHGVARMGGFPGRKCDGNPGTKTLWEGLRCLDNMVEGYLLATQMQ